MQKINLKDTYDKANEFYKNKNFVKAKELYLNILMHDPEHPQTNNNLGLTYRNLNEINKAINCFKIALKRDDNYTIALNNLAKCLHEVDNIEDSVFYFEKSLKIDPNKKETYTEYAQTLFKANQHEKALRYLNIGTGTIKFSQSDMSIT